MFLLERRRSAVSQEIGTKNLRSPVCPKTMLSPLSLSELKEIPELRSPSLTILIGLWLPGVPRLGWF